VFDVALAATYDEDKPEKYNLDNYFIQRKLNGLRLITIIEYNEGNIKFSFKSRKGKDFTTMGKIQSELEEIYKKSLYYGTDIVIDGEVCIVDENGKEDWNRIVSEAKRKNHIIYNPRYICFDIMTKEQFYGFKQSMKYSVRYDNLKKFLSNGNLLQHLRIVFSVAYNEEHFKKLCKEFIETDLWEGFIFRKNCAYKSGRSIDLLKYKVFKDAEFIVLDIDVTEKAMLNENTGLMEDRPCVGALIFEYKGNRVKVGSGLDDIQRIEWYEHPEWIIGKQIQVKYKEETINSNGTVSLQFPVLKYVFDGKRDF
jgi:DNA ligase-1